MGHVGTAGFQLAVAKTDESATDQWWQTPLLAGAFALVGVLIAQCVVLWLARRNERNRSEPELLRQCSAFSVATGRLKREFVTSPDAPNLSAIGDLDAAADAIDIIGTPDIEAAATAVIGSLPMLIQPGRFVDEDRQESLHRLFSAHMAFIAACRQHFNKPPKVHVATPILVRPPKPDDN
ncbi:hypothetical protein NOCA2570018 [metagenome]|uniref:Transmembrane protein n=1 Tax=metagenome TaxID=256318 RepID=A0A2P2CAP9_9ZZZZ